MRKLPFCICENKDADQLRGNREADQRLCFRSTDSTILLFLNPKFQASSHLLWLDSLVWVGPGQKPQRPVFSQRGSYNVSSIFELPRDNSKDFGARTEMPRHLHTQVLDELGRYKSFVLLIVQ